VIERYRRDSKSGVSPKKHEIQSSEKFGKKPRVVKRGTYPKGESHAARTFVPQILLTR